MTDSFFPIKPLVLFMVPTKYTTAYIAMMKTLVTETVGLDGVELIGFVSDEQRGPLSLHLLSASDINPQLVTGLVLWGESGDHLGFHSSTAGACVPGSVIIQEAPASIPTMCIPSIETEWLKDKQRWVDIKTEFTDLVKNGRKGRDRGISTFLTPDGISWN